MNAISTYDGSSEKRDEHTCVICDRSAGDSNHTLHLRRDSDGWYRGTASVCTDCASEIEEASR